MGLILEVIASEIKKIVCDFVYKDVFEINWEKTLSKFGYIIYKNWNRIVNKIIVNIIVNTRSTIYLELIAEITTNAYKEILKILKEYNAAKWMINFVEKIAQYDTYNEHVSIDILKKDIDIPKNVLNIFNGINYQYGQYYNYVSNIIDAHKNFIGKAAWKKLNHISDAVKKELAQRSEMIGVAITNQNINEIRKKVFEELRKNLSMCNIDSEQIFEDIKKTEYKITNVNQEVKEIIFFEHDYVFEDD